ncbi:MAG: universal stress protein [Candidatus Binatia bacterium]
MIPAVHTVLAPTDFSELANRAIPHAYSVVDDGGTVHLLLVVEATEPRRTPNPLYAHYVPGRTPTLEEKRQQHAELAGRLRDLVPVEAGARLIRTEVHVVETHDVAAAIVEKAEQLDASLVCIGTHGRSALIKAFLGSVASAVLADSLRPVLLVRSRGGDAT